MTLLDPGIVILSAIVGVSFSLLGFGVQPDWTALFAFQLAICATVMPAIAHSMIVGFLNLLPERAHTFAVNALVGASQVGSIGLLLILFRHLTSDIVAM